MGIPILRGRAFDARDRRESPKVAIVNQEFVRRFLPDVRSRSAVRSRTAHVTFEIIGVCGDVHFTRTRNAVPPTWYPLFAQAEEAGSMTFEVRSAMSLSSLVPLIREAVRAVDKDLPIFDIRTQTQQIDSTMIARAPVRHADDGVRRACADSVVGGDLRNHGAERVAPDE